MNDNERRLRALHLYFGCSRLADAALRQLLPALSSANRAEALASERTLRRECGLLLRHWAANALWEKVLDNTDATQLNLELLRLCTSGFKLQKDGSGLRYAELALEEEEAREFWHRLTQHLGIEDTRLLSRIEAALPAWKRDVIEAVDRSLAQTLSVLEAEARSWTEQAPPSQNLISEDA